MSKSSSRGRRFFAPEIVQTSAMDCGPAALKSLLDGFNIRVSYGRLREACQTTLDGSSIDTVETVACRLGLHAEQVMIPPEHLLLPESAALPAIVVVQLPTGVTHFVVAWRRHGKFVQVMDPSVGRRWIRCGEFLHEIYRHRMKVPANGWREFAASAEFQESLRRRLVDCGLPGENADKLRAKAASDPEWRSLATLDAATRLVQSLIDGKALSPGSPVAKVLDEFLRNPELIPEDFWSVHAAEDDDDGSAQVLFKGAVLVRVSGVDTAQREVADMPELRLLESQTVAPGTAILRELFASGPAVLLTLIAGALLSSVAVLVEALLFRQLFDIASDLRLGGQRIGAVAATLVFLAALLVLDVSLFAGFSRLGRQLEGRLRIKFLRKIPLLGDAYFQSRLLSDMAERSHATHRIRNLPDLARQILVATLKLIATAAGLIWLEPANWFLISLTCGVALIPPFALRALLNECDLRIRNHAAGLTRFYLDAMLGLLPIRAHNAARSVQAEQNRLLGSWAQAALRMQRVVTSVETAQLAIMFGLVACLLFRQPEGASPGRVLLAVYWAMSLPALGEVIAGISRRYAYYRNLTLRLLEPLGAPEEPVADTNGAPSEGPVAISFADVGVEAASHAILRNINLDIAPGSHVAIVGPSGAGKSTLAGLLLGWHKPASGELLVDGVPIDAAGLRPATAWVDPAVQLWNRSLLANVCYGSEDGGGGAAKAMDAAMLRSVLENLPEGMQTSLGEGGAFVSGGEGQRIRLARAMLHKDVRLVVLDEPFRGLDREKRKELLRRARTLWAGCTLLCITHDIGETELFDRVAVVENGTIAEQGIPGKLRQDHTSRYCQLLAADVHARTTLWSGATWRRVRVQNGRAIETARDSSNANTAEVA